VATAVVHSAGREAVTDTWVAGRPLVSGGRLTRIDAVELISRARRWQPTILATLDTIAGQ
jgi:cytosine/adenosine deaminase-related metal-dependent hydrolase